MKESYDYTSIDLVTIHACLHALPCKKMFSSEDHGQICTYSILQSNIFIWSKILQEKRKTFSEHFSS